MRTGLVLGWLLAAVVVGGGAYWFVPETEPEVAQPINFSHLKHQPFPCNTCHRFYLTRQASGVPKVEVCAPCHAAMNPTGPELVKLRGFIDRKEDIPWRRVYKLPEHVFYSHRTHVVDAKLPCATCHGPVEAQRTALTRPLKSLTMEACMDCHRARKVTNDCNACHK